MIVRRNVLQAASTRDFRLRLRLSTSGYTTTVVLGPQSSTPAVDVNVRIYYANRTTAGLREQFSMLDTVLSGPGILQFSQASDLNFSNEQSQ